MTPELFLQFGLTNMSKLEVCNKTQSTSINHTSSMSIITSSKSIITSSKYIITSSKSIVTSSKSINTRNHKKDNLVDLIV